MLFKLNKSQQKVQLQSADVIPDKVLEFTDVIQENGQAVLKASLIIKNNSLDYKIAFKVKTNNIQNYLVKPSQDFIEIHKEAVVDVTMYNRQFAIENQDKFLIQIKKTSDTSSDIHTFWKDSQSQGCIEEKKLDVDFKQDRQYSGKKGSSPQPLTSIHDLGKSKNEIFKSAQNKFSDEPKQDDDGESNYNEGNYRKNYNHMSQRSVINQSFNNNQHFLSMVENNDEYKKQYENLLIRVDEQEKIMFQLNEEKLRFQREHNNLKNLSAKTSKNGSELSGYQNGLKIWNAAIIAIVSLLIGMLLSR